MAENLILIAEDDPIQRLSIKNMLANELDAEFIEAPDGAEALNIIKANIGKRLSLALLDLHMPNLSGMELLKQAREIAPNLPLVVLTGSENIEDAVGAMQHGAADFISKPAQKERLVTSMRNALAIRDLQQEVKRLQQDKSPHYNFDDIERVSPSLKNIISIGRRAAASNIPVLITGESGVGKEVFAHAIHSESIRTDKPFISVNCGALPENLVESTLFGHEKGSFTGATQKSIGKCREADGGVLFLDEIGELKPDAQVKLLRLLQQGEIEPVGSTKPIKVDVRIISATNRSLEKLISQGKFREDLYYRLNGLPLQIPSLKERRKDIASLSSHLLKRIALAENRLNIELSDDAVKWLSNYSWPGNVRELQHILSRALLLTDSDILTVDDLARWAQSKVGVAELKANNVAGGISIETADGRVKTLDELEQEIIEAVLNKYDAHIGKTAVALGIGQSTLYKKMKRVPDKIAQ